jgi:hypothetical protein
MFTLAGVKSTQQRISIHNYRHYRKTNLLVDQKSQKPKTRHLNKKQRLRKLKMTQITKKNMAKKRKKKVMLKKKTIKSFVKSKKKS